MRTERAAESSEPRATPSFRDRQTVFDSEPATWILGLQQTAGNAAVARFLQGRRSPLSTRLIQRVGDEIKIESIVDRLQHAIRDESRQVGHETERSVEIDAEKVGAALEGLTQAQGRAVQEAWKRRDKRDLRELIAGVLEGDNRSYLSEAQRRRLLNLLEGTAHDPSARPADVWDPGAERRAVDNTVLIADVARLRESLENPKARGALFDILRRRGGPHTSPQYIELRDEYKRQWNTGLYVDFMKYLRGRERERAEALLEGKIQVADTLELRELADRRYGATATPQEGTYEEQIERRLEDIRRDEGGDPHKVQDVLGTKVGTHHTVGDELRGGHDAATNRVLDAIATGSEAEIVAAKLARLEAKRRLKATDIERALVELRMKAITQAAIELARNPGASAPSEAQRKRREENAIISSFLALRVAYTAAAGRSLELLVASTGSPVERERNRELLRGAGVFVPDTGGRGATPAEAKSAAFIELDLAIRSHDSGRIRAALAGKTKREIDKLSKEWEAHKKISLWQYLHAFKAVAIRGHSGSRLDPDELAEAIEIAQHGAVYTRKTTGDRLANVVEEGNWYWRRIETLYQRTMKNRGLFAELRDWRGNVEHDVVELALARAKQAHDAIKKAAATKSMKSTAEAMDHVDDLKASYNRLQYNVDVYSDATRAAFSAFVDLAVTLVGTALSFTTGTPAAMLIRNIAGTVGTKLVLLREDYSAEQFVKDVVQQSGGALGGQVATAMLHRGIPHLTQAARATGLKISPGISALAGKGASWAADQVGGSAGASVAAGGGLTLPSLEELVEAAELTLAHYGKSKISRPRRKRPGRRDVGKPADPHGAAGKTHGIQPEPGVRKVAALPNGGRLKLLENGRVAWCQSPCVIDDTLASSVEHRFEHELTQKGAEAHREAVADLRRRERAAIDARDDAARDRILDEVVALSGRLEAFRTGRVSARTGVPAAQLNQLIPLAGDNVAVVEELLHHARNDVNRVRRVLDFAAGDRDTAARLADIAGKIDKQKEIGDRWFKDERLRPYGFEADIEHILGAHTLDYFKEWDRTASVTSFWPKNTTRAQIEAFLVEAIQKLRKRPFFAPPPPEQWQEIVTLDNGLHAHVGFNGAVFKQFFPVGGPGFKESMAPQEIAHVGTVLFGRVF